MAVLVLTGCSATLQPATKTFAAISDVVGLAATSDGGVIYAVRGSGNLYKVGANDPIGKVDISKTGNGVTGLALDDTGRLFVAFVDGDDSLSVAQVDAVNTRIIWKGPRVGTTNVAGRITFAPNDRLVVSVGDLGDPSKVSDNSTINGKLLTLDPERNTDQAPNVVSQGWTNPLGIAYSAYSMLWVADGSKLGRSGEKGFSGQVTDIKDGDHAVNMTKYGDQEFALCMANSHKLQRFTLDNGVRAVAGRVMATDCETAVATLKDGRLVYATKTEIRATAL